MQRNLSLTRGAGCLGLALRLSVPSRELVFLCSACWLPKTSLGHEPDLMCTTGTALGGCREGWPDAAELSTKLGLSQEKLGGGGERDLRLAVSRFIRLIFSFSLRSFCFSRRIAEADGARAPEEAAVADELEQPGVLGVATPPVLLAWVLPLPAPTEVVTATAGLRVGVAQAGTHGEAPLPDP